MSKTRAELKAEAKEHLQENWGYAIGLYILPVLAVMGIYLACILVYATLTAPLALSIGETAFLATLPLLIILWLLVLVVSSTVTIGVNLGFLNFFRGGRPTYTEASTYLLKENRFLKFLWTNVLMVILLYLWSLLFLIPGIIKTYSYSMTNYILKDKLEKGESVTVTQAITESRQLMNGHKWEYFVLQLSFIGWAMLANLTFGIGYLWLVPYIETTNAAFYQNLIDSQIANHSIVSLSQEIETGTV